MMFHVHFATIEWFQCSMVHEFHASYNSCPTQTNINLGPHPNHLRSWRILWGSENSVDSHHQEPSVRNITTWVTFFAALLALSALDTPIQPSTPRQECHLIYSLSKAAERRLEKHHQSNTQATHFLQLAMPLASQTRKGNKMHQDNQDGTCRTK